MKEFVKGQSLKAEELNSIINTVLDDYTEFSDSLVYYPDSKVLYGGQPYRFITTHDAGAWNSEHVEPWSKSDLLRSVELKIGKNVIGHFKPYETAIKNLSLPIGTKIKNTGVSVILFDSTSNQREDMPSGYSVTTTFIVDEIRVAETEGEVNVSILAANGQLEENAKNIQELRSELGQFLNITLNNAKDVLISDLIKSGTTIKITVSPVDTAPDRIILYHGTSNNVSDRLYDSKATGYDAEKTVVLTQDINNVRLFASGFQPVNIRIDIASTIKVGNENFKEKSIEVDKLAPSVIRLLEKQSNKFSSFKAASEIDGMSYVTLPQNHVGKNYVLTGRINSPLESISIGVGYSSDSDYKNRQYNAFWVAINSENVEQYRYFNGDNVLVNTEKHGIAFTSSTVVTIIGNVSDTTLRIYDTLGNTYEQKNMQIGCGTPFIHNAGTSPIDVELSFYPKELTSKIWAFGDSYFNFSGASRWPYYFAQDKATNWMSNNQPGLSPDAAYNDLVNLLALGHTPTILVWCLGMNGSTQESVDSGDYVINSYQKTNIDKVCNLCNEYGIELILATIPTVPGRQKTGFNNYIKSLGTRYIDFAKAVGATPEGLWYDGLLSSDAVHPTEAGAVVLSSQVMLDAPELTSLVY